jgi:hypothetical protein
VAKAPPTGDAPRHRRTHPGVSIEASFDVDR